jgi:hypothetical protein
MEPTTGIEPVNLILTKDALYLLSYVGRHRRMITTKFKKIVNAEVQPWVVDMFGLRNNQRGPSKRLERETGFEPATLSLEG